MPGPPWTAEERKSLRRQLKQGCQLAEVRLPGRTLHAIRSQAARMRLVAPRATRAKWSEAQKRRLRELKREGFSPGEIFRFELLGDPPRTRWSITKQWGRMKLADRNRSRKMRKKKRWKPGEKREFDKFLRKHSASKTPEEIGRIWQVARSTVARRQNELGLKRSRAEVMRMAYSLAKQRRASQRLSKNSKRMWVERRAVRERQLRQLADKLRSNGRRPAEQTCPDCGRSWPKRREFFHIREKKISLGTSRYYKHRCVFCENERRRNKETRRRRKRSDKS